MFKKKTNAEGKVEKYKARLVAKGYSQVSGIDFGDIFSPVAKVTSIRLLLSITVSFDFEVEQMDVKITFLDGGSGRGNLHEAMLGPYNTSDYSITVVVVSLINIVVPLLSPYFYYRAP